MNKQQLERNVGSVGRLRPAAKDENDHDLDDDWLIENVTEATAILKHTSTAATLSLGLDHIKERMSDPARASGGPHPRFGFLLLNVEVRRIPGGSFISEPIVPRLGRAVPPRGSQQPEAKNSVGPTLTWQDIEARFKELRQQEIASAGSDRLVSALTHAEPGEPDQWRLMGGSQATRADADRLCRIAGGKLRDGKWQRPSAVDDFARWLAFVISVGGHTRHLHSSSSGANQPSVERDDYWIRDLVTECLAAVREALAREETGTYAKPEQQTQTTAVTSQWASAAWKKGGVQSVRVKNETDDVVTGIKVLVRGIQWLNGRSKWVMARDVPENYFPKILTAGSSRITSDSAEDFTFISQPQLTEPRIQLQELDGSGLHSFRVEQHGDRRVQLEITGDGQPPASIALIFRWEKNKPPEAL